MEAELNMIKNETQDYVNRCSAEAKQTLEDVHVASHDLDIMEREAAELLKATQLNLQGAIKQSEEKIQMRARELLKLVDSISKYKEYVESKISEMNRDLSETATAVSEAYRDSFPAQFINILNSKKIAHSTILVFDTSKRKRFFEIHVPKQVGEGWFGHLVLGDFVVLLDVTVLFLLLQVFSLPFAASSKVLNGHLRQRVLSGSFTTHVLGFDLSVDDNLVLCAVLCYIFLPIDLVVGKTRIGLAGLAVMGQNLALNIAEKGFPISVYN
ncbi:6-phosphogluconate dehydrogenase, decarboxylating [Arachis hypogaea]|nr:6-phosphogluconate dehydrogenase, decarboxylating [Arachis hypogaea]